jgi:hypothetical protein
LLEAHKYSDGLLKVLRYGTRKPRVTRPTIELRLLSSEGLNNHDSRRTIEDVSYVTDIARQLHRRRKKRTLQGSDLHTVPPEPTSGRDLNKTDQNATEEYRRIKKRRLEASASPDNSEKFVIQKELNV